MSNEYRSWALIWTVCGRSYLADVATLNEQDVRDFLQASEDSFVRIGAGGAYEYQNPVGMNQQGKLSRQTLVLPVDSMLDSIGFFVRISEVFYFCQLSDDDYAHYVKLVESGNSMRTQTKAAKAGLVLSTEMPKVR